jgi:hypothetical protein
MAFQLMLNRLQDFEKLITDGLVKSRHSRENGNPEEFQVPKKTGFLLAQE